MQDTHTQSTQDIPESVVTSTLQAYAKLANHGKPQIRSNAIPEWTILASISLTCNPTADSATSVIVTSIATGVKCLAASRLPPLGDTVHDCHAEILARRGFVRWLIAEAGAVASGEKGHGVLVFQEGKFCLAPGVQVWLYVSALPCGDASTLHTAAYQPADMAEAFKATTRAPDATQLTPGEGVQNGTQADGAGALRGRRDYESYGAIRTKPGRPDSPPSISLSCSDKIATWNALGVQGALLSGMFAPIYLDHIVVGGVEEDVPPNSVVSVPEGQRWRGVIEAEVGRALWGRLDGVKALLPTPYRLTNPRIHFTSTSFPYSKPAVQASNPTAGEPSTSTVCLSAVPRLGKQEVLINGCNQTSAWRAPGTRLLKDKQRSRVCKLEIMRAYLGLEEQVGGLIDPEATYHMLKHRNSTYQAAKAVLRGLPAEVFVSAWSDRLPHEFLATAAVAASAAETPAPETSATEALAEASSETLASTAPFKGWIVTGPAYESFTRHGTQTAIGE